MVLCTYSVHKPCSHASWKDYNCLCQITMHQSLWKTGTTQLQMSTVSLVCFLSNSAHTWQSLEVVQHKSEGFIHDEPGACLIVHHKHMGESKWLVIIHLNLTYHNNQYSRTWCRQGINSSDNMLCSTQFHMFFHYSCFSNMGLSFKYKTCIFMVNVA